MEKYDGRQMSFDGHRPQFLGGKGVRYVLKPMPHVSDTVIAALKKDGNTRTYPKVYPCAKMLKICYFSRSGNQPVYIAP